MTQRTRIYDAVFKDHLARHRQMLFVSGPRQVGKTTACRNHANFYLKWDNTNDRDLILKGPSRVAEITNLQQLSDRPGKILFDELHKFARWKQFLKGFFDSYETLARIIVTGSSRLDTYRRTGDSLMGRYFLYRMHPFSVAEILHKNLPDTAKIIRYPREIKADEFDALWNHGGYPEPFIKRDNRFTKVWQSLRKQQLLREDLRELTQIYQLDQMGLLVEHLEQRSSQQLIYSNLARELQVTVDTIRRWVDTLSNLHHGFLIRPWFKNISRSLRKEPKWFLRDWSGISDIGPKAETFVACHLLKAVEGWNDLGFGTFHLNYLRDKSKREVDFIVIRDGKPWFLVEVKNNRETISESLAYYHKILKVPHAFQVVMDAPFVNANCFQKSGMPIAVPARTLLSQLF